MKKIYKRLLFLILGIYVIYTFIIQQKTLNAYQSDQDRYNKQIEQEQESKNELVSTKENINSKEYVEEIARNKLGMYLPNEKVYIDIGK